MDGAGGELMDKLIRDVILSTFSLKKAGSVSLDDLDDGATISLGSQEIVFTIDGHTVQPVFFPGGDLGKLAISGTVNDLAVMGAKPMAIAVSLILENGFEKDSLKKILKSMNMVSTSVPVPIITGDTKVVEDQIGIYAITAGIGVADYIVRDSGARVGDAVLINGGIGEHGFAIMSKREGLEFETELKSDTSPIWNVVESVANAIGWENIHAMKDPTRGGLSEALNEMAMKANVGIEIEERAVPMDPAVRAAGEMLGISPYIMANEGKVVMIVPSKFAQDALDAMRKCKNGKNANIIGRVTKDFPGKVILKTGIGGRRFLERPIGDPVPRVC